jgi:glutaredoxin-like YruB-family protein
MRPIIVGVVLFLLCAVMTSHADMYKWEDANGVVTFKDTPPPASKRQKVKVYTDSDFAVPPPAPSPSNNSKNRTLSPSQPPPAAAQSTTGFTGTIEMYATEWCGYCAAAENYMKSKNYSYVKYDIEKDSAAKQRHKDLGGRGVPLIIIGPNKMSGFSPKTLEYYLGRQ